MLKNTHSENSKFRGKVTSQDLKKKSYLLQRYAQGRDGCRGKLENWERGMCMGAGKGHHRLEEMRVPRQKPQRQQSGEGGAGVPRIASLISSTSHCFFKSIIS